MNKKTASKKLPLVMVATLCMVGGASLYLSSTQDINLRSAAQQSPEQNSGFNAEPNGSRMLSKHAAPETSQTLEPQVVSQTPRSFPGRAFAPSIEGTEIDGRLKADANGNLIIDLEVRDLFDYFMNTVADVEPEIVIEELERLARDHLPESAANQAMALLDDYLAYKEEALTYSRKPLIPAEQQTIEYQITALEQSFTQLKEIRRSTMSREAVDAFFGMEEAYGEYTIASIRIQSDPSLSIELKQLKLEQARTQLPPMLRKTETRMHEDLAAADKVNALLASNMSDTDLQRALVEEGLDDATIQDAMNYRSEQQNFDRNYALYAAERDQLKSSGLSESDMLPELENLRQRYFSNEKSLTQARVRDLRS